MKMKENNIIGQDDDGEDDDAIEVKSDVFQQMERKEK